MLKAAWSFQARALSLLSCDGDSTASETRLGSDSFLGHSDSFRGTSSRLSAINESRGAFGQHLERGNTHVAGPVVKTGTIGGMALQAL